MVVNQEESLVSGIKFGNGFVMEEFPTRKLNELDNSFNLNWETGNSHNYGEGRSEVVSEDIVDLLPRDPFGMDISATVTAISGWIEDFGLNSLGFKSGENEDENVNNQFLGELNIVWNSAMGLHADVNNMKSDTRFTESPMEFNSELYGGPLLLDGDIEGVMDFRFGKSDTRFTESPMQFDTGLYDGHLVWEEDLMDYSYEKSNTSSAEFPIELNTGLYDGHFLYGVEDIMGYSFEKYRTPSDSDNKHQGCTKDNIDSIPGPPPDALLFALGCLGVRDLLSVERVCRSLRDAVQGDPLIWRNIHIEFPLCHKITDDELLQLTKRAQGNLHSLSLLECRKITDNGLKRVLKSNPGLTKLNVAGCQKLSIEGILGNLKFFQSVGRPGIKYLRIGGHSGLTSQHFQELKLLLGTQNQQQQHRAHKPRFLQAGQLYLSFDDERDIDIETCPRCQQIRQVYDCPADSCRGKLQTPQACRACTFCISRCRNCGRCLSNCDYEETFCLDLICLDCLKQVLNFQEGQKRMTILPRQTYLNQQASYHFILYG